MKKPITARPWRGLAEAILLMRNHRVDTLLIVDSANQLMGKVTMWDIQSHFQQEDMLLRDVMHPVIHKVNGGQPLSEALQTISKNNITTLPVVSNNNELLGVITRASLVDVMAEHFTENTACFTQPEGE